MKVPKWQSSRVAKKVKTWWENQTRRIRNLARPKASRNTRTSRKEATSRAHRFMSVAAVAAISTAVLGSFFLPKDQFQQLREKLVKNPNDFEAHLQLAERFLENHQFQEAEQTLLLAQGISSPQPGVLGQQTSQTLEELWQRKHNEDPADIRKLIAAWEKIVNEKPNYRDGWLQLAVLNYKIYQNDKAREYLNKALDLDPNFEPAKEFEKTL